MAARRRKCLETVNRLTSAFTSCSQTLSSVCAAVRGKLVDTCPSNLFHPIKTASESTMRCVTQFRPSDFCDECNHIITKMRNAGTSVDPPSKQELQIQETREIRERLIIQALLHPEINNDKTFAEVVDVPEVEGPPAQRSVSYDYLHVRYPLVTYTSPIPGSGLSIALPSEQESDISMADDNLLLSVDSDVLPSISEGEIVINNAGVASVANMMAFSLSAPRASLSFGHEKPTYNETFGQFGIRIMRSLPSLHLRYIERSAGESPSDYYTCPEVIDRVERIPVPIDFAWIWLRTNMLCFNQQSVLGKGTQASVLLVHLAGVGKYSLDLTAVALKAFHGNDGTDTNKIIMEADKACYMASIGVGPAVIGLTTAIPDRALFLPSIMMEYMPGSDDLFNLFKSEYKPSRYQILDILVQTARLLTVVHNHGFLHNDIKLTNILVIPNPLRQPHGIRYAKAPVGASGALTPQSQYRAFLIDFGLSTYQSGARCLLTEDTPADWHRFPHLPPEVFLEGGATSTASDVYSFGMLLLKTSDLLGDSQLAHDLLPIVHTCTQPVVDRPLMASVERQLAAKLPKYKIHTTKLRHRFMCYSLDPLRYSVSSDNKERQEAVMRDLNTASNTRSDPVLP